MFQSLRISPTSIRVGLAALTAATLALTYGVSPAWSATAPNLGTAAAASVVAGTTVTNTGSTTLSGDLDVYPGTAVTGFPPGTIGGTQNTGGPTGGPANVAANDVTNAYLQVLAAPTTAVMNTDLGGQSLSPGVYTASSGLSLTGTLTLVGSANSVFIFQAVSTLITAPGSRVVLSGGVQACNVDWQVGSSATLATTTSFVGNILALSSITMDSGASLNGRALARNGAVTLDNNSITSPTCNVSSPTTTSSIPATTTSTTTAATTTTTSTTSTTSTTLPVVASTTTTIVRRKRHSTPTTTPPLVGAPVTGGGPVKPTGRPWPLVGLLGMGGAVALYARSRRVTDRR